MSAAESGTTTGDVRRQGIFGKIMNLAATYVGRLGLTAWRRKSTLLGLAAGLVIVVLCLQYNAGSRAESPGALVQSNMEKASAAKVEEVTGQIEAAKLSMMKPMQGHDREVRISHNKDNVIRSNGHVGAPPPVQGVSNSLDPNANNRDSRYGGVGNVQFVQSDSKSGVTSSNQDVPQGDAIVNIKESGQSTKSAQDVAPNQPSREDIAARKNAIFNNYNPQNENGVIEQQHPEQHAPRMGVSTTEAQPQGQYNNYDQQGLYQMGVPYVNIDPRRPYVPQHRLFHLDLKGAPPKVSFLKRIFPLVKQLGATGVLLEWEDMFPFTDTLAPIRATNCYSKSEVKDILEAAKGSELDVIPLVQTFGHVEFALKHHEFSRLREVPDSPQALCPSLNSSFAFVGKLIDQVMEYHLGSRFLHIGCDEVFQMGECQLCRTQMREALFLSHVSRVANYVRTRYPGVTPIIWDDMLRHLSPQSLEEFHIGELVEPMVWVYAEDVYRFVPTMVWDKYAAVFPRVWSASAFKGAFGETLYIPNVKRHLENNLRWLEVMTAEGPKFKGGFRGIAITGWQRYDHFAVLCELLPAAVPSLAVNLIATSNGYFNQSLRAKLYSSLGCARTAPNTRYNNVDSIVSLNSDPYLWEKFGRCFFPGAPFFKLTHRLHAAEQEVKEFLESVTHSRGWLTEYNVRHKFSSPLRMDELMADHPRVYHTMTALVRSARDALEDVFDKFTIAEWIEQRLYPDLKILEQLQRDAQMLKSTRYWPRRPFPPLRDLRRFGVPMPEDSDANSTLRPPGK
ncbi:hexosaminidase D [Anabrus simplex]|uniref:hexosaminidase D n=1 Tax=Anabrus simplex TaxID=316456 RepID=UPI0035A35F22